jgi:hypothetical protein
MLLSALADLQKPSLFPMGGGCSRVFDISRLVTDQSREIVRVTVDGYPFDLNIKISPLNGKVISMQPGCKDLKQIATTLKYRCRR